MKIYYSVSVRGGSMSKTIVGQQIAILKNYGFVLTEHLASNNVAELNMNMTDNEIYKTDMRLLEESNIVIADCTAPSHGVGYIISKAETLRKPVLCTKFCQSSGDEQFSAMIEGCPHLVKEIYRSMEQFEEIIRRFLISNSKTNRIIMMGPPGSGKSTIAKKLSSDYDLINISTGQILRDLVKNSSDPNSKYIADLMAEGQLIPADIMKNIVFRRLTDSDCVNKGFVLDGYPPSREDLDNLDNNQIKPTFVFYFECKDETAITRQCRRGERNTDVQDKALDRIKIFHDKIPDYQTISGKWWPNILVIKINAENDADIVYDTIKNIISTFSHPYATKNSQKSYFPIEPYQNSKLNTTRFHFHIDAPNHEELLIALKSVYAYCPELIGQIKMYPIYKLCTGKQIVECDTYDSMINFHNIKPEDNEAFVTGRLGDELHMATMKNILLAIKNRQNINSKIMVELEEYTGEWVRNKQRGKSTNVEQINKYIPIQLNMSELDNFNNYKIKHSPVELHLAFDLSKEKYLEQPIDLQWLNNQCSRYGLSNGGWFIFKNDNFWAYRSNEFVNLDLDKAIDMIHQHAKELTKIVHNKFKSEGINVSYSIELVHGIWIL